MTVLSILISTAIAVAVVFVLRAMDRDNNSMDKVRRYADNRINQLDEYFKEQISKLNGLTADLDAHQTAAVAAVKRIEKQIEDFKNISRGFESQFAQVENISTKVDEYGRVLEELMVMTDKVEENLQALQKESVAVDKLNARLDEQKKTVELIDKKIPAITQDFKSKNNESLKIIGAELLNQYKSRAEQLENAAKTASAHSDEVLAKVEQGIRRAYDEAAQKAQNLEDQAFQHLSAKAKERTDEYIKTVNERTAQLNKALETKIAEAQRLADQKNAGFSHTMAEKSSALEAEFRQKTEGFAKDLNSKINGLEESLRQQVTALDQQIKEQAASTRKTAEELKAEVNGNGKNLETIRTKLEQQTAEIQSRYGSLYEKAIQDADQKESAAFQRFEEIANKHLDTYKSTVENKINSIESQVNSRVTALNSELSQSIETIQKTMSDSQTGATATAENIKKAAAEANEQLSAFQTQADQKIKSINDMISQAMTKISSAYDLKQTELLSTVDKQLEEYRNNMEYRFNKLETTASDIDTLENNLRAALGRTQQAVVNDFNNFSQQQQASQAQFEAAVKRNNEEITQEIAALEKNLDSIRQTASDNVSATLADFEVRFGDDLKKRGEAIDDNLTNWKNSMDSKLAVLGTDYENSRREMENQYTEKLREQLTEITARNQENTDRFQAGISRTEQELRQQLEAVENEVRAFVEKGRAELENATSGQDSFVKTTLDQYNARIAEQMARAEKDTEARIAELDESIKGHAESNRAGIDAMLGEYNAWRNQLKTQFDQTKLMFTNQMDSVKNASDTKLAELEGTFQQNFDEFKTTTKAEQDALIANIADLKQQVEDSVAGYKERSEKILAEMNGMYENMLNETQRRVREQNADADKALRDIKTRITEINDENDAREAEMVVKMQNDAADLQTRMSEIDREVKAFASQMQVYQKADQLKNQLDAELAELKNEITRVESFQSTVDDLNANFRSIQVLNEDVNGKLQRFNAEKAKIDGLERDFNQLVELSSSMDSKINELQTTSDDLQSMQLTVRTFQETLGDISSRYERLEKKETQIDQIANEVDKTFDNLKSLELRLNEATRHANNLPDQISDVQKNIDTLVSQRSRINEAVDQLSSLQSILDETEQRINEIKTSREGIANVESRLHGMEAEIDKKMNLLAAITRDDMKKNPQPVNERLSPQDRENILALKRQGWTIEEIASRMNRTIGEVEMVIDMGDLG